ncbi:hypothetical protein TEA_023551 [Camellia sinensis var. sinensis]|uniref:U1-type domain-containing protein n=1 Tax=Camellia sinensis var. sinensis TaxID=542762 RepID=A0A4S4D5A3_CAMSN|nr:hypothetical protein TEA_023551 [Camellia sinensis var. sinensis]
MDLSTQYQQQQQQQQQTYGPSQVQTYDQSAQAYYQFHQYNQYLQQQQYPYYPQDYSNAYQSQQEHTSIHPPGVPIAPESTHVLGSQQGLGQTHVQNQPIPYYPQEVAKQQPQQVLDSSNFAVNSGGFGPISSGRFRALVGMLASYAAAFSYLLPKFVWKQACLHSFLGFVAYLFHCLTASNDSLFRVLTETSMQVVNLLQLHDARYLWMEVDAFSILMEIIGGHTLQIAVYFDGLIGQTPYTGGGRRGGRPFRGRGSGLTFRGRGRGRGRGGPFPARANNPSAFVQGESSGTGQAPFAANATPVWPPPRMAWCELCRVDCNTLDILEQHKNGKRHRKNLQVYEELQKLNSLLVGQNEQTTVAEVKQEVPIQPEKVKGAEDKQPPQDNLASGAVTENKVETEQKKISEEAASTEGRGLGFKRKMRGGRGGKWMRTHEGSRRPVEPPKPKQVVPLVCELCNVKCDSQVVFESHLTGKKHVANTKRFQGHQAMLGQAALQALYPALQALYPALQALYPPNPDASTSLGPQSYQGVHDSQGLFNQLAPLLFPPGQASAPGVVPTSGSAQLSNSESRDHQDPKPEQLQVASKAGSEDAAMVEAKSQQKPISDSQ